MRGAVICSTERDFEFIARLAAERAGLHKLQLAGKNSIRRFRGPAFTERKRLVGAKNIGSGAAAGDGECLFPGKQLCATSPEFPVPACDSIVRSSMSAGSTTLLSIPRG